jgi:hypothetical protein
MASSKIVATLGYLSVPAGVHFGVALDVGHLRLLSASHPQDQTTLKKR